MVPHVETGCKALIKLTENTDSRHRSTTELMRRLWRENIRHFTGWLMLAILLMAVMASATAFSAWLMKPVVNDVFIDRNQDLLWPIGLAVLATFLIKGFANYGQAMLMNFVGLRIIADTQNRLYAHLAHMDLAFFHARSSGTLISRFTNDINQMRNAVSNAITSIGKDFLSLIGLVVVMFIQDWHLALIAFFIFPVAIFPIVRIGRRMRKVTTNTQEEMGLFTTLLGQTFQGIRIVKSYGMETYESGRIAEIVERIRRLNMKAARTQTLSSPIMETLGGLAVFVVIVYGGSRVIEGETDSGAFFSFITALLLAYEPMKRLANLNAGLQQGLASAERLYALLDIKPRITDRANARALTNVVGAIRLDDVRFFYEPNKPALDGVTIDVPAGKTVALVGPSGAGKSTILNLIPRFYDIDSGIITIDGIDIRDVKMESVQANIALVSQEITLFDDTVAANIAYGRGGASQDEVIKAARHAAADEFIEQLSSGYDTIVGEQGIKLSGGQRQRLAIARAMLKNAPMLLLDEATSALDTESERKVQTALSELMRGRTTLVIAHRLSTVVDADLIYVIDKGRVVEMGNHTELLGRKGSYKRLYAMQFEEETSGQPLVAAVEA